MPDQYPEIDQSKHRPHDEQHVGFRLHRMERKEAWDQQQQYKKNHQHHPGDSGILFGPMAGLLSIAKDSIRKQRVDHRRTESGHIDNPPDRRPAEKRNKNGYYDDRYNRRRRNTAPVQSGKHARSLPFPSRRIEQAA